MLERRVVVLAGLLAAVVGHLPVLAQVKTNVPDVVVGARPATVERITIHGTALEGNLEGDSVDRDAIVFLPPSYDQNPTRHYPVVYALHGYSIGAEQWTKEIHVPQTIEGAFAKGAREMISRHAGLKDGAQRLDVLQFGDHRRFRALRSRATWRRTSTRTIGRSPAGRAAASSATPWAAMVRAASA